MTEQGFPAGSAALAVAFGAAFLFLLAVSLRRPSSGIAVAAGGFLGLAALCLPVMLALGPLSAAALFDRRYPARICLSLSGSVGFGFLLCLGSGLLFRQGGFP